MSDERIALLILAMAMGWLLADAWKIRRVVQHIEKMLTERAMPASAMPANFIIGTGDGFK